jgi:hypothetical protein
MKLRELLKKFRLWTSHDEGMQSVDDKNVDALATMAWHGDAPTNWVPSQQDERPRH